MSRRPHDWKRVEVFDAEDATFLASAVGPCSLRVLRVAAKRAARLAPVTMGKFMVVRRHTRGRFGWGKGLRVVVCDA